VAHRADGALSTAGRVIKLHRGGESTLFWNGVKGRQKSGFAIGEAWSVWAARRPAGHVSRNRINC